MLGMGLLWDLAGFLSDGESSREDAPLSHLNHALWLAQLEFRSSDHSVPE